MRISWPSLVLAAALAVGCVHNPQPTPLTHPAIIPHTAWQSQPPFGYPADATRRNKKAGDSLSFHDLTLTVLETKIDSTTTKPTDVVRMRLSLGSTIEERRVPEGAAFNWNGFHIAVVAVYGPGELGAGLVAFEVATVASLPPAVAQSPVAGGADMRLRIPHRITHVTLHHEGSAEPLRADDDPKQKLRALFTWGARDRNWWDLPYHFMLGVKGDIYEGRDWHFMGETNTAYDPGGHFLITAIGNYEKQEPTPETMNAIADMMAWAIRENGLTVDVIGGHYNYADTGCPGKNLRKYLEDGTFRRMVQERLKK